MKPIWKGNNNMNTELYNQYKDLINVGAYNSGSDPLLDEAIMKHHEIEQFLQQTIHERISIEQSLGELSSLFN